MSASCAGSVDQPTADGVLRTMSLRVATTAGELRVRSLRAPSPKTTSLIQWTKFSIFQWSQAQEATSSAVACPAGRSLDDVGLVLSSAAPV